MINLLLVSNFSSQFEVAKETKGRVVVFQQVFINIILYCREDSWQDNFCFDLCNGLSHTVSWSKTKRDMWLRMSCLIVCIWFEEIFTFWIESFRNKWSWLLPFFRTVVSVWDIWIDFRTFTERYSSYCNVFFCVIDKSIVILSVLLVVLFKWVKQIFF